MASILSQAVAPVFLITGASSLIAIMSHRYGRVVDRIRILLRDGSKLYQKDISIDHVSLEIHALYRRAKILRFTIILTVLSVFLVCSTVFVLYLSISRTLPFPNLAQACFIGSLVVLMIALTMFIQDFMISLGSIKHDIKTRSDIILENQ